jgi:hypothetical protein
MNISDRIWYSFIALFSIICVAGVVFFFDAFTTSLNKPDPTHELAKSIVCSKDQLTLMQGYFITCDKSGYMSSHCFDLAVINSCGIGK